MDAKVRDAHVGAVDSGLRPNTQVLTRPERFGKRKKKNRLFRSLSSLGEERDTGRGGSIIERNAAAERL